MVRHVLRSFTWHSSQVALGVTGSCDQNLIPRSPCPTNSSACLLLSPKAANDITFKQKLVRLESEVCMSCNQEPTKSRQSKQYHVATLLKWYQFMPKYQLILRFQGTLGAEEGKLTHAAYPEPTSEGVHAHCSQSSLRS